MPGNTSLLIFVGIAFIVFVFGFAGYRANIIQFGLDQLLEAPSSSLALFIHWIIWADSIGKLIIQILIAVYICEAKSHIASTTAKRRIIGYGSLILTALNFFVILSLKYCDFYSEPSKITLKGCEIMLDVSMKHTMYNESLIFIVCVCLLRVDC